MGRHAIQFFPITVWSRIGAGTRSFQSDEQFIGTLHGGVADLYVSEEYHAGWSPVFHWIGKYIAVHKGSVGLTNEYSSDFTICIPDPHGGLSFVNTHAKEVEVKNSSHFA